MPDLGARSVMPRLSFQRIATIVALVLLSAVAVAQEWPAKPVRIVVPFPPGGSTDVVARLIVQRLAERLNQQFVVENRPGAAGRFPGLPQMQSATEQGIDVVATVWFAIVGPAATPRAIVERMNSEVNQILASPEGKQKLDQFGLVMVGGAPEVLGTLMAAEAAKWKRVIDTTRISIE